LLSAALPPPFRAFRRLRVLLAGVVLAALYAGLLLGGYLEVTPSAAALLLGVWSAGLLGLVLADGTQEEAVSRLTFGRALWCNVGVVATSLLVPHPLRLLLLVAPLLGVLFTALRLHRAEMLIVGIVTWLSYVTGAALVVWLGGVDHAQELRLGVAFTGMLGAMLVMASEVTDLKVAFERRRERLNEAMQQLAELAMRDELTGLCNRRYIMDVLTRQKALADRGHVGFALCYCDLDHFKRINDRHGHHAGDQVLKDFAEVALSVVRSVDYVARLGGEEFLLVLVGADADTAQGVAERLCARSKFLALIPDEPQLRLTVSVGIATFRRGERVEDVIQRADQALYAAKSAGRDRIVIGD